MAQAASNNGKQDANDPLSKYKLSLGDLHNIRKGLLAEMDLGLKNRELNKEGTNPSTVKMLPSHVHNLPTGKEHATFYTLDWGGTNFRVLRLELLGRVDGYVSKQKAFKIEDEYRKATSEVALFDHLGGTLKEFMIEEKEEHGTCDPKLFFPIGFCFSFPMYQPSLEEGVLVTWTKGFTVPDVVGHDVGTLMNQAFQRLGMHNVKVDSIVNDTVGTLLACSYEHENTRVGLILGTGSNCAYLDPSVGEVINCEWGNFGSTNKYRKDAYVSPLPRVEVDEQLDANSSNQGEYFAEKMMSGRYLGELVRLASIEIFGDKVTKYGEKSLLNVPWMLDTKYSSILLDDMKKGKFGDVTSFLRDDCGLTEFSDEECKLFANICEVITMRSADVAASMLTAVLERTGFYYDKNEKNGKNAKDAKEEEKYDFVVCDEYTNEEFCKFVTIGIDGSVYNKDDVFRQRMHETLERILGKELYQRIRMTKSDDGSGKGAALAACCSVKKGAAAKKK